MSALSSARKQVARTEMELRRDQWLNQMDAQDNKCAECHGDLVIENTAKRGMTNEIVCQTCYQKPLANVLNSPSANS
jgi:hypothetical protein